MAKLLLDTLMHLFHAVASDTQIIENMTWTLWLHPLASQSLYPSAAFRVTKSINEAISEDNQL
jgi:hypothetical protein